MAVRFLGTHRLSQERYFTIGASTMVSLWVKPIGAYGSDQCLYGESNDTHTGYQHEVLLSVTGQPFLYSYDGGSKTALSAQPLVRGTWNHILGRFHSGAAMTLFVNGVQKANTAIGGITTGSSYKVRIGGSQTGAGFNGELANVASWQAGTGNSWAIAQQLMHGWSPRDAIGQPATWDQYWLCWFPLDEPDIYRDLGPYRARLALTGSGAISKVENPSTMPITTKYAADVGNYKEMVPTLKRPGSVPRVAVYFS